MAIRRVGRGYPGAVPSGRRRVPGSLRRHLQIHKMAGGYPCGEHHQKISSRIPQVHCVQIWRPKPHPRSNGQVERANAEILRGLKTRTYNCLKKHGAKWV